jgi:hypothetical protein
VLGILLKSNYWVQKDAQPIQLVVSWRQEIYSVLHGHNRRKRCGCGFTLRNYQSRVFGEFQLGNVVRKRKVETNRQFPTLERLLNKLKGFVQEILRGLLLLPNKS